MANTKRNFIKGRMNKMLSNKLIPDGEYIDALNIRVGATEDNDQGVITNMKGNSKLTTLAYDGDSLSSEAVTLGSKEYETTGDIYWMVHDPAFTSSPTGKLDMIVSYNPANGVLTYHVISVDDGGGVNTTLNFNPSFRFNNLIILDDKLFFTDYYEEPRRIYTDLNYANPVLGVDGFSKEELLVIKKPPYSAPLIEAIPTGLDSKFLRDRFVSFAYRYRYHGDEYSATSQWTLPAFTPSNYDFSTVTSLNQGMLNISDSVRLTFNSGSKLVKGVDILMKEYGTDLIKVVEKIDKEDYGYSNDAEYEYLFADSKVFTLLPEAEILRHHDSVPLLAGTQSRVGNRLIYGNYVQGRDMIDLSGDKVKLDYSIALQQNNVLSEVLDNSIVTRNLAWTGVTYGEAAIEIDFTDVTLVKGAAISIDIQFTHGSYTSNVTPDTSTETEVINLTLTYILTKDHSSISDLIADQDFLDRVGVYGVGGTTNPIADACTGSTWTDQFNCATVGSITYNSGVNTLTKEDSGVTAATTPIFIQASGSTMIITPPLTLYTDAPGAWTDYAYEHLKIEVVNVVYAESGIPLSLHSNRGYEVNLIYMDEYGRGSDALSSKYNTLFVPYSASKTANSIQVTIPPTQKAPAWATKFKFAIKADVSGYNTVYSRLFYKDSLTNNIWIGLDGEQARKVEDGDILLVKADTSGVVQGYKEATVLEKSAKEEGFIITESTKVPPSGVYMKLQEGEFAIENLPNSEVYNPTTVTPSSDDNTSVTSRHSVSIQEPTGVFSNYSIPTGSNINIFIEIVDYGTFADVTTYNLSTDRDAKLIASTNYNNIYEWFIGDNVAELLNAGKFTFTDTNNPQGLTPTPIPLIFIDEIAGPGPLGNGNPLHAPESDKHYCQFYNELPGVGGGDGVLYFTLVSRRFLGSAFGENGGVKIRFKIERAPNTIVFESKPTDTIPGVAYIGSDTFAIDSNGYHEGTTQNQTGSLSALIKTSFANCYTFGNGVESYKIQDSMVGKTFELGMQATSNEDKEYKAVERKADLTYSGVYNDESNVNRLNEFNAGLFNYKHLEDSFGTIELIDGRKTDLLVLQSDKISYVLLGKNLLSDATGQSLLTSVPEVLGTQISRIENYGISHDPSSYVKWGDSTFFSDALRGVLIQLTGSSYQNEKLTVISNARMRNWFRDLFTDVLGRQKIGGYDPFADEYIFSVNETLLPFATPNFACGIIRQIKLIEGDSVTFTTDLGAAVGTVDIDYTVPATGETFQVIATYNGVVYDTGVVSTSGTLQVLKTEPDVTEVEVQIISVTELLDITATVKCVDTTEINVFVWVVTDGISNQIESNDTIKWDFNTSTSPEQQIGTIFKQSGTLSEIFSTEGGWSGSQGTGMNPPDGATVTMANYKGPSYNFDIDPLSHRFYALRTNATWDATFTDLAFLIAEIDTITMVPTSVISPVGYGKHEGSFTIPLAGDNLYLIFDYR